MDVTLLRDAIDKMIDDQPLAVHRYVLILGDGISTGISWSWSGSWVGRKDTLGREVWFAQDGPVSVREAKRSFNVVIPYSSTYSVYPKMGDKIELFDLNGNSEGVYDVNWSEPFFDNTGKNIWKIDVNVQETSP